MKIYAKQVPPEYQESPLFNYDWPENVFVFGNHHYNQHDDRLQEIRRALEDLTNAWGDLINGDHGYYDSWIDALNDLLPPDGRSDYTRAERKKIAVLAHEYYLCNGRDKSELLCDVLELVTGREWEAATIRGCCQGDWQEIIYPAEYGRDWLETFETEYFNTGTEWIVDPDGDGYSIYCTGWNNDLIRAEIADAHGCDPGDVVLLEFTGWSRTAEYEEASA
jgi:hypothetical protein